MQHEYNCNGYRNSEISLTEVWSLLVRRKMLILSPFLFAILTSSCFLWFTKPVYESRSMLRIGQIGQSVQAKPTDLLEDPYILVKRLTEKYKINDNSEGLIKLPKLTLVDITKNNNNDTSIITIEAQGNSALEAKKFLKEVTDELLKDHQVLYDDLMSKKFTMRDSLKQELQKIDSKINLYDKQITSFKGRDDSLIALLVQQKLGLEAQRTSLERQISDLEMYLEKPFTFATELIRQPTLPVRAINKRPVFYLVLAGTLGLMFGILLVVFLDYIKKQKEQRSNKQ